MLQNQKNIDTITEINIRNYYAISFVHMRNNGIRKK